MDDFKVFEPRSDTPPSKVKDVGISRLVMDGAGAFNTKGGELLLLPAGEAMRLDASASMCRALLASAGVQSVNCGSDEGVFSLAERYVRTWGAQALSYVDTRGRELRILAWSPDGGSAVSSLELAASGVSSAAAQWSACCVADTKEGALRSFRLLSRSDGASPFVEGYVCGSCGKFFLPSSPYLLDTTNDDATLEEMTEIETPGADTIAGLCAQLGLDIKQTVKAMLCAADDADGRTRVAAAYVRGDLMFSMAKLSVWLMDQHGLSGVRHAEKIDIERELGDVAGFCGPVGLPETAIVVCDKSVVNIRNAVVGANKHGYHIKGCCWGRDFTHPVADIAQLAPGSPCDKCGSGIESARFREIGELSARMARSDEKVLSYRDRDGAHSYPAIIEGRIATDALVLSRYEHIS